MNILMNNGMYWVAGITVLILFLAIAAVGKAIISIASEKSKAIDLRN
jgi:hypothetical protein